MNAVILRGLCFGALMLAENGFSHGGGLNSEGCHNNWASGDYHCHRGSELSDNQRPILIEPGRSSSDAVNPIIPYKRNLYGYKSYKISASRGFYTEESCYTNIDHVVSLKDAHESGAGRWEMKRRVEFSNDRLNHVPSCRRVNSSKGSSVPSGFFRKSADGRGMEYKIKRPCAYLGIYYQVKIKYGLSFANNDFNLFGSCGLKIR
jgi:hypothetical protein